MKTRFDPDDKVWVMFENKPTQTKVISISIYKKLTTYWVIISGDRIGIDASKIFTCKEDLVYSLY